MAGNWKVLLIKILGCVIPALIPPIHIAVLYYFWGNFSRKVDKRFCSCSCWDTVYKGTYESGIASYKHVYFNATPNTAKIWVITVVAVVLLYECVKNLLQLLLARRLRLSMLLCFVGSIFPHYYSWWVYFNYWNDEFYKQWNHQLFFTVTEVVSSILIYHLADKRVPLSSRKVLGIAGIAVLHIVTGSWDQFVVNVIWGEGLAHQVVRDLGFMVPDMLNVFLPLLDLIHTRKQMTCFQFLNSDFKKDVLYMAVFVFLGFSICSFL